MPFEKFLAHLRQNQVRIYEDGESIYDLIPSLYSDDERRLYNHPLDTYARASIFCSILKKNSSLEELYLGDFKVSPEIFKMLANALAGHSSLKILELSLDKLESKIMTSFLKNLQKNYVLEELSFQDAQLNTSSTKGVVNLLEHNPMIKSLNIAHSCMKQQSVKILADMLKHNKSLKTLGLAETTFDNENESLALLGEAIKQNTTLTALHLSYDLLKKQESDILKALEYNTTLYHISDTAHIGFFDSSLSDSQRREPYLQRTHLDKYIYRNRKIIESIKAIQTEIGKLQFFRHLRKTSTDDLSSLKKGFFVLSNCIKRVQTLCQHATQLKALQKLQLELYLLYPDVLYNLMDMTNQNATTLHFAITSISDASAKAIANFIRKSSRLHTLHISSDSISDESMSLILATLQYNTALKELSIPSKLNQKHMKLIANVLSTTTGPTLNTLCLSSPERRIENAPLLCLLTGVKNNRSLQKLELSRITLTDSSTQAIVLLLKTNTTLRTLNLAVKNRENDTKLQQIASALESNTTLTTLEVRESLCGSSLLDPACKRLLKRNQYYHALRNNMPIRNNNSTNLATLQKKTSQCLKLIEKIGKDTKLIPFQLKLLRVLLVYNPLSTAKEFYASISTAAQNDPHILDLFAMHLFGKKPFTSESAKAILACLVKERTQGEETHFITRDDRLVQSALSHLFLKKEKTSLITSYLDIKNQLVEKAKYVQASSQENKEDKENLAKQELLTLAKSQGFLSSPQTWLLPSSQLTSFHHKKRSMQQANLIKASPAKRVKQSSGSSPSVSGRP